MATEIELKARVPDSEAIKSLLAEKAEYRGAFEKNDTYWFPGGDSDSVPPPRHYGLRLRKETRVLPGGTETSACVATRKIKEIRDGVEINEEREFEVNPGTEFECFLRHAGFKPGKRKRKKGWAFFYRGICAELVEVEGLGWFVELEILASNARDETVGRAQKQLKDFLAELGIGGESIESRPYAALPRQETESSV